MSQIPIPKRSTAKSSTTQKLRTVETTSTSTNTDWNNKKYEKNENLTE